MTRFISKTCLIFRPVCLITSTLFAWAFIARYISTDLPGHVDLVYLINYPVSYFDQFAWSLRPYLPEHPFLVTFRPICPVMSTLFTISIIPFRISTNLPDHFDLICLGIYFSLHFDQFARPCRPCLPDQSWTPFHRLQAVAFTKKYGVPVLCWVNPVRNCVDEEYSVDIIESLLPGAVQYFVLGAPANIIQNHNPVSTGIVNGSRVLLHSLVWRDGYTWKPPVGARPGQVHDVPRPACMYHRS